MFNQPTLLSQLLRKVGIGGRYELPSRETWEREYRDGSWDYLQSDEEMPRYAVIADYLRTHCPGGALLDAGCGEGVLCDHLWPGSYSQYLGIDFSVEAIARAGRRARPDTMFMVADVSTHVPEPARRFDAIVFNEVLYCTTDPRAVIAHWTRYLQPQGVMVASIYSPWLKKLAPVFQEVEARARHTEEYAVHHPGTRRSWVIKIWSAPGQSAAA
jgi:2-polyprenyl-3-methyl-5-hydroxy-6-metoxy-1,4-benzoquinol methylase